MEMGGSEKDAGDVGMKGGGWAGEPEDLRVSSRNLKKREKMRARTSLRP